MTRVLVVAASSIARARLQDLLRGQNVEVVGEAPSLEFVGDQVPPAGADVVLVDYSGERFDESADPSVLSEIPPGIAVVILADAPASWSGEALQAGARGGGVLAGDLTPEQLTAALNAAAAGLIVMHPTPSHAAVAAPLAGSRPLAELTLTRREREVLHMVAGGLGNKEIASRLVISEHTVKSHVASILQKLGAGSRTEAVSLGIRRGLVLL